MPRPRFAKLPPDKRHRILRAAAAEFAEHGYTGASLNRIIGAAGISKGAAYYYFDDKADLFAAVLSHGWDALLSGARLDVDALDAGRFWPALERAYAELVERVRREPWLMAVGQLLYHRPLSPESARLVEAEFAGVRRWLHLLVMRGQTLGVIRRDVPAELLLVVLMAALEAADRWVVAHPEALDSQSDTALAPHLFEMLRRLVEPAGVTT
jgi:AcrR family transcriptional regulator